jgi:hypothetical protein
LAPDFKRSLLTLANKVGHAVAPENAQSIADVHAHGPRIKMTGVIADGLMPGSKRFWTKMRALMALEVQLRILTGRGVVSDTTITCTILRS